MGKCQKSKLVVLMDIVEKEDAVEFPQEIEEAIAQKCVDLGKILI